MPLSIFGLVDGAYRGFGEVGVTPPDPVEDAASGLGYIGDSLTAQSGSAKPYDGLVAAGWDPDILRVDSVTGRGMALTGTVHPNVKETIDTWRASGFDPGTWIIALGSYNTSATDAQWEGWVGGVLDYIAAGPRSSYLVHWVGLAFRGDPTGSDTRATRFQTILNGAVGSKAKVILKPLDWNKHVHNGRDETALWDTTDATNRHMTAAGYTIRNDFITTQVTPVKGPKQWTWSSSAIEGGGFQNVVAPSPFKDGAKRPVMIGADVSGPFRSESGGALWVPCGGGSGNISGSARISAYMWSDTIAGKVFAAEDGAIWRSLDYGKTWSKRSGTYNFDGNGTTSPEHPRPTGYLLAQDNSGTTKYVWAGTFTQGVKRSTDDFNTVSSTVLSGHPIRSLALNPNNPDQLFVAVNRGTAAQNGLWVINNARSAAMTATKITSYPGTVASPIGVEELLCVKEGTTTYLYVAGHESGMFRYNVNTGAWTTINTGLPVGSGTPKPVFRSLCVDPSNPQVLYSACWHPFSRQAIFKTSNRGDTWASITGPNPVTAPATGSFIIDWNMYGTTTRSWLADISYHSFAGPNSDWVAACLQVDPDNPNKIYASGRGGCWIGTRDTINNRWTWQPAVHGLIVTVCMTVTPDELTTGRALIGNMDYKLVYTADGGLNAQQAPPGGPGSTGDSTCMDMSQTSGPSTVYVGVSQRGQATGSGALMSSSNPVAGPWTDESTGAFNSDVVGIAVGKNSGGTRVILAAVSNTAGQSDGGLWMKVGNTWSQRRTGVPGALSGTAAAHNQVTLRWKRNSQAVYAHDSAGIWRSNDAGTTWVKIYTTSYPGYGTYDSLVIDSVNPAKVYIQSGGTVRRIENADTAAAGAATVTSIWSSNGGNVAIHPDGSALFVNVRDGRIMRSTKFRTAMNQTDAEWENIASGVASTHSGNIRSMAVLKGGVIMTADNGSGALRGVFA